MTGVTMSGLICIGLGVYSGDWVPILIGLGFLLAVGLLHAAGYGEWRA